MGQQYEGVHKKQNRENKKKVGMHSEVSSYLNKSQETKQSSG